MRILPILLAFLALFAFGCAGISNEGTPSQTTVAPAMEAQALENPSSTLQSQAGYITIEVPQGTLDQRFQEIQSNLQNYSAVVSDMTYNQYSDRNEYTITVAVPPSRFDDINNMLKQEGEVKEFSVTLQDVTKQYVDLDNRINNSEIELDRLHQLYNQSNNVSDLLQIEQEITRVETDLESLEQQKQDLVSQVEQSTIVITVYEQRPPSTQLSLSLEGLGSLFFGAVGVAITVVVAAAGFLIPLAIVVGVLWLAYKTLKSKSSARPRKPEHSQIPPPQ